MSATQLAFRLSRLDAEECPRGVPSEIWSEFIRIADEARKSGVKRWAARSIIEIMRYENVIKRGNRDFKVNNVFQASMSRAYMHMRGCWGFFEVRGKTVLDHAA